MHGSVANNLTLNSQYCNRKMPNPNPLVHSKDKEHPHNDIYHREVHEQGPLPSSRLDIPISIADIFLICRVE